MLAKNIRREEGKIRIGLSDDRPGRVKYYGLIIFVFLVLVVVLSSNSESGNGQINAFTSQLSSKNYRLDAEITLNPNAENDMLHFFKKDQYKITSVTWPNGEQDDTNCIVREDSRVGCDIGGQTYYVEVAWFQSDDNGSGQ